MNQLQPRRDDQLVDLLGHGGIDVRTTERCLVDALRPDGGIVLIGCPGDGRVARGGRVRGLDIENARISIRPSVDDRYL
jgi:hypothetical protein